MSFFAVLDVSESRERGQFAVEQCHINLWALQGLWPRRRMFYLDVGVKLSAKEADVHAFSLVLPFGTSRCTNLTDTLFTLTTAELIFDSDISYPESQPGGHSLIRVGTQPMHVLPVSASAQKDQTLGTRDVSVWDLKLAAPLRAGQTGYARVRFPIEVLGSAWQWQRSGLRRSGAILDFRLLDQRSTATLTGGEDLRARALELKKVAIFTMVPAWLHGRAIHPALNYIRVLESKVWAPYLGRKAEFRNRPMVVFSWKGDGLSLTNPLRIYTDFTMRRKSPTVLLGAAMTAVALLVGGLIYEIPVREGVRDASDTIVRFSAGELAPYVPATFIGAIALVVAAVGMARLIWQYSQRFRKWAKEAEEAFFRNRS